MPESSPRRGLEEPPGASNRGGLGRAARRIGLLALPLLPVVFLVVLIARYAVNVPFADEFTLAPLLVKAREHAVTFSDLFAQHNEHRYFFPRLIFIALSFLAQGDLRAGIYFSVFLVLLTSLNLSILLRKTMALSSGQRSLFLFLFNLLLFSPVQAENWMWGFQFPLFFCGFLFTCGLVAACSSLSLGTKFVVCAIIAFGATFSFGGGVLLWGIIFPVALLWHRETTWKSRGCWFAAWSGAGLATMGLYFFRYVTPPTHPALAAAGDPVEYFVYITGFLGAHLSRASSLESVVQPVFVGTLLLALFFGAAGYAVFRRQDPNLTHRMLPWFGVGGYVLLTALLAAVTRIGFGVNQALDSRYTSFSLYLSIAAIALFALVQKDLRLRGLSPRLERALLRGETILLTGFAILFLISFSWGHGSMLTNERVRLLAKGALLFTNVIASAEKIHEAYLVVNATEAREFANQFDSIGLMHPPMVKSAEIAKLETRPKLGGFLDELGTEGQTCSAKGWAILPNTLRSAHCVVLSYHEPGKGEIAFRIADKFFDRPDVARAVRSRAATSSGWACHFDRSAVPSGDQLVSAWAFDANRAILYPLGTPKILH